MKQANDFVLRLSDLRVPDGAKLELDPSEVLDYFDFGPPDA